jgi:protein TonB
MRKLTLFLLLMISTAAARSQTNESFYVFDENWKPTKMEKAHYFLHTHQMNDTCWQFDFYNFMGPMIKSEQYRDKEGTVPDGFCRHYNEKGVLDSTAQFRNGKENGEAMKLSGKGLKFQMVYKYKDDTLVEVIDMQKQKKDSVKAYGDEKESDYPEGTAGWQRYLQHSLEYPERAMNGNKQGQVIVGFIVDKEGIVNDTYIAESVEYSLDEEALKVIKGSGRWESAFQNGRKVKSYKTQPINFRLQRE